MLSIFEVLVLFIRYYEVLLLIWYHFNVLQSMCDSLEICLFLYEVFIFYCNFFKEIFIFIRSTLVFDDLINLFSQHHLSHHLCLEFDQHQR